MKEKVIKTLTDKTLTGQEKFNRLLGHMTNHRGHVFASANYYNRIGYSPKNLENLTYDVKKLYEITDDMLRIKNDADLSGKKKEHTLSKQSEDNDVDRLPVLKGQLLQLNLDTANYAQEIKPLANELANVLSVSLANQKKNTLLDFLHDHKVKMEGELQKKS